jgi:hypothetical protein
MVEEKVYPQRTKQQNKALHVMFRLFAEILNENGLDMRRTLKPGVDIPWSAESVKEYLWRPVMEAQLNKKSTTQLTTKEVDEVFDTINKYIGEKHGLHIPFPSIEILINERDNK